MTGGVSNEVGGPFWALGLGYCAGHTPIPANNRSVFRIHNKISKRRQMGNKFKQIKKWAKHLNRHFTKEETRMVNKPVKRWSTPWTAGETQVETTTRCHYAEIRRTTVERTDTTSAGEDTEELELSGIAGGSKKQHCHSDSFFYTRLNMYSPYDPAILLFGIYLWKMNTSAHTKTCTWV